MKEVYFVRRCIFIVFFIGGFQIITYLHRLLQLKYPMHLNAITLSRVEEIVHEHCRVAYNYQDEIKNWTDSRRYDANVIKIQLPYVQPVTAPSTSSNCFGLFLLAI